MLFHKYLVSTYYVPALSAGDSVGNKTKMALVECSIWWRGQKSKFKMGYNN